MNRAKPAQAGFSLVELLAVTALLGVGLLGLARLQVAALGLAGAARARQAALALATGALEQAGVERVPAPATGLESPRRRWARLDGAPASPATGYFQVTVTRLAEPPGVPTGAQAWEARVVWREGGSGRRRELALRRLLPAAGAP